MVTNRKGNICTKSSDESRIFIREITNLNICQHPNIIPILDVFIENKSYNFDMPCVPYNLFDYINQKGEQRGIQKRNLKTFEKSEYKIQDRFRNRSLPTVISKDRNITYTGLDDEETIYYATLILKAINHCHRLGIWHRDLKPENILVNGKDLYVIDFGLSLDSRRTKGYSDTDIQTIWYRSPEVFLNNRFYDEKIDEWSIGCIIAEMINGNRLFDFIHEAYNWDQESAILDGIFYMLGTPSVDELTYISQTNYDNMSKYNIYPGSDISKFLKTNNSALINVCRGLLQINSDNRLSCAEAYYILTGEEISRTPISRMYSNIRPDVNYNSNINLNQRRVIIERMFEIRNAILLQYDTILNSIVIFDKISSMNVLTSKNIELYIIVSMFISSSLNSDMVNEARDYLGLINNAYTIEQFDSVLSEILKLLNCNVSFITISDIFISRSDISIIYPIFIFLLSSPLTFDYTWDLINKLLVQYKDLIKNPKDFDSIFIDNRDIFKTLLDPMIDSKYMKSYKNVYYTLHKF
ncbi:serine-threonine kinase [Orpheovirus IHUMI-LCC2]|uniref:Protein kinase n=1 Tax=Orpheovirus IHUMI-LCC2 TaxID=2023057 RepID=A0A2I2L3Z3_9VIRU|nr:serine-threonine kinase [Orpheovirus IHUMI-LCC2]SNW62231.1 Protein kinase [Orpheovirus IHUMI-LCC2]